MKNKDTQLNENSGKTYVSPEIITLRNRLYDDEKQKNEIISNLKQSIVSLDSKEDFFKKVGNKNLIRSIQRFLEKKSSSASELIKADLMKISIGVTKEKRRKDVNFFISIIYPNGVESLPKLEEDEILNYIITWTLNNNMESLFNKFFINGNLNAINDDK